MACPLTKTLRVSFTPPSTPPDNGYRVRWREVGAPSYTTAVGTFTGSPITLQNIPACVAVEGTVEAVCGATYSNVASFSVPAGYTSVTCAGNLSGTQATTTSYTYPLRLIDLAGSADSIGITWNANDLPNRFTVYNSNKQSIGTSGWVGVSNTTGPWGQSLNTATTGTITFNKSTSSGDSRWYYLQVETAGHPSLTDAWNVSISCSGTTTTSGGTGTATLNWSTQGDSLSTGILRVKRTSDNVSVLENTSSNTTQTGSVTLSAGVQYTITGLWGTGSGNIIRVRVCNNSAGTEVGYSGDVTNANGSWSVNLTPVSGATYSVRLTSGSSLTPVVCPVVLPEDNDFYLATKLTCPGCTLSGSNVVVAFPSGTQVLTSKYYYKDGFSYMISSATTYVANPAVYFTSSVTAYDSCTLACNSGATTSTTTSGTTTTTTTTSTTTTSTGGNFTGTQYYCLNGTCTPLTNNSILGANDTVYENYDSCLLSGCGPATGPNPEEQNP